MDSPGLCPFLPLMRGDPKELFIESRKKIKRSRSGAVVIERRFGEVPADLRAQVESVTGLERLEWLHDEAVTCVSLAKLSELLDRA